MRYTTPQSCSRVWLVLFEFDVISWRSARSPISNTDYGVTRATDIWSPISVGHYWLFMIFFYCLICCKNEVFSKMFSLITRGSKEARSVLVSQEPYLVFYSASLLIRSHSTGVAMFERAFGWVMQTSNIHKGFLSLPIGWFGTFRMKLFTDRLSTTGTWNDY